MNNEIVLYKSEDGKLSFDVKLDQETIWLTQTQMAKLFEKTQSTINEHIKNIYKEKELSETNSMRKFGISENTLSTKPTNFYNLDVVILNRLWN